ncbi:MAG: ATP-binding protein [Cyanobacteria bacterium P01_A01_bin.84]
MKQDNPVPKLDLAPKLKRSLSLWKPLDYLRLLYWVFYFPQALRWYVNTFGGGYIPVKEMTLGKGLSILRENTVQRQLLFQSLVITVIIPFLLCLLLEKIGIQINWSSIALGIALTLSLGIVLGTSLGVVFGTALCITSSVAFVLAFNILRELTFIVALGVICITERNVTFDQILNMVDKGALILAWVVTLIIILGVVFGASLNVTYGLVLSVIIGITFGVLNGILSGILSCVLISLALGIVIMRPDNWLVNVALSLFSSFQKNWLLPRITYLPLPQLKSRLIAWFYKDWDVGIENVNQILEYSLQFFPVVSAIEKVLNELPEDQIIFRVSQLAQNLYDWRLFLYISIDIKTRLKSIIVETIVDFPIFFFISKNWKEQVKYNLRPIIPVDTPITFRTAVAGFWFLYQKKPAISTQFFSLLNNLLYGEELFILTQTLSMLQHVYHVDAIASLNITTFPTENLLRPSTWQAMNSLRRVVDDIKLVQHSASRNTKSLAYSHAIGELAEVINNQEQILEAERALIVNIAQNWKQTLEKIGKSIGDVAITKPVRNPYVIGNPVTGSLFVGRKDILRQLEELWILGNQLQSVVLYGHRRMGKTSILVNIAQHTGAEIKVVYINLQRLGAISQGVAEVLIAISDAIAKQLNIESPSDEAFLTLPQRTFERYLQQVIANMNYRGLIIALDEFETIEELIKEGQLDPRFMGFLRGLIQIDPAKLAFAFAGLHTLEEMTADYFQPFYASVIPIKIGFVSAEANKTLLANPVSIDVPSLSQIEQASTIDDPDNDFLLDYTAEALDLIYSLTSGQPYLTQLIGFQLVRNYNDQVFEQNKSRESTFTVKDVESVVSKNFFQQGRYYFEGVWGQAAQDTPGQRAIIIAVAPHPQGITKDELISVTGLIREQINAAIATLERHDVIQELEGNYRIIVELFRRWVMMYGRTKLY